MEEKLRHSLKEKIWEPANGKPKAYRYVLRQSRTPERTHPACGPRASLPANLPQEEARQDAGEPQA